MKVEVTDGARADLQAIHGFLCQRSEVCAHRTLQRITRRMRQLETFPLSGREMSEYGYVQVRELVEAPYRIAYHVLPDRVRILFVIHGSADLREESGSSE